MRYEQTFNIINFDDKLKGLEDQPGYPKMEKKVNNKVGGTLSFTDYNIISNKGFNEHHFLPPQQRPPAPKEEVSYLTSAKRSEEEGCNNHRTS